MSNSDFDKRIRSILGRKKKEISSAAKEYREQLHQAKVMCNLFDKKICITYQNGTGLKNVEADSYFITDDTVIMRTGMTIPFESITDIKVL